MSLVEKKRCPSRLELGAQLAVVVDAAVEDDRAGRASGSTIGCGAALGQVDDLQPPVGEARPRPATRSPSPSGPRGASIAAMRSTAATSARSPGRALSGESAHPRQLPAIAPSVAYPWRHDGADQEATAIQAPRQRRGHHRGARSHRPQAHGRRAQAARRRRRPRRRSAGTSRRPGAARSTARCSPRSSSPSSSSCSWAARSRRPSVIAAAMLVLYIPLGYYMDQCDLQAPAAQSPEHVGVHGRPHAHRRAAAGELLSRARRRRGERAVMIDPGEEAERSRGGRGRRRHARGDPADALPLRPHRRGRAGRARDGRAGLLPGARDRPSSPTSWRYMPWPGFGPYES